MKDFNSEVALKKVNQLYNIFCNEIADFPKSELKSDLRTAIPKARELLTELEDMVGEQQ